MRAFKLTNDYCITLFLISKGKSQAEIAKELNESRPVMHYRVKRLLKEGYITLDVKTFPHIYLLTEKGNLTLGSFTLEQLQTFNKPSQPAQPSPSSDQPAPTIRDHAYEVKFELKDRLPRETPTKILQAEMLYDKPLSLKHQEGAAFYKGEYEGLLTHSNLIIYADMAEMPLNANIELMQHNIRKKLFKAGLELEMRLKLKLKRDSKGLLMGEVVKHEIALKNHQLAKDAKENESKLYVYDEETGELTWITDFSNGFPELEAVSKRTAQFDAQEATKATKWMGSGSMRGWVSQTDKDVKSIADAMHSLVPIMKELEKNIKTHNKVFKKLDDLLSQRKL